MSRARTCRKCAEIVRIGFADGEECRRHGHGRQIAHGRRLFTPSPVDLDGVVVGAADRH